jgi:DNA-directed RNA polymerase specialized sigma24 family protein
MPAPGHRPRRPEASFLRTLYAPLLADAQREIELALKVVYGIESGMSKEDIAARLGVSGGEVKTALSQVRRARERLERGG